MEVPIEFDEDDFYILVSKGPAQQSTFGSDFGKGATIGVVAALAALYAVSKCSGKSKKEEARDFQRA